MKLPQDRKKTGIIVLFFFKILILTFFAIPRGFAQEIDTQKLDSYFNTLEAHNKFIGSVAVLKNGKLVYSKQTGFSDLDAHTQSDVNTKYRIGSVSKLITATLIFKAIEEGKIGLNETIEKYYPDIENSNKITLSYLLNHRSGIHNFTDEKQGYLSYHHLPKSESEMIEIISKGGSDFAPNTQASYSNSNYVLLSYILEKIYSKSYSQILKEQITDPLKLTNTYFGGKITLENNESYSYDYSGKWKKLKETHTSISMGAGGIVSTPSDLVQFARALFTYQIISSESVEKMKTLQNGFGMGLFKTHYYDRVSFGHNGEIDGFTSVLRYFPYEDYAFAITSNGNNYSMNLVTVALVNSLLDKHYDIPDFRVYKPKSKELDQYTGVYSSDVFPVKLVVTKKGKQLHLQASGDSIMSLQATAKGEFKYDPAGISIVFNVDKQQLIITQKGKTNTLNKE